MDSNQELQERAEGLFNRAKAVTLKPAETWPVIAKETDAPMQVFLRYAVPLAAIGPIASFIGGQLFGYGMFGISWKPTFLGGLSQAITAYVLTLASLWLIAWVANFLSPKFGGKDDFSSAFRLAAYSMTAAWIVGIFGIVPALSILGLLGLYSLYLFYKGASPMMDVPQDKATGYTVVTVVVAIVANIVIGMIAAAITGPAQMPNMAGDGYSSGDTTIQIDSETGRATINVDGEEMSIQVPVEEEE
ncbi:Yip1 family protein [Erythrobacter sp. JK5]|uniref:Yip1 family protein n=1 Tax=Erythrobacter sp. JK5 TaxID=2829500 RepID=UPI001BA5ABC9|nr:Yip1 family protein [Erythrobacter sp. JK5]QUL38575.1 YIP1 family protein [Erythrobacter sp. JK5]